MRISELAQKAGIRASAVRFYEKAGVLPLASRQSGQRHFTPEAERYLAVIGVARRAGFTVAEIRLLFHGFRTNTRASARWRSLTKKKHREIDILIANLQGMQRLLRIGMRCRCLTLADCGGIALSRHNNR